MLDAGDIHMLGKKMPCPRSTHMKRTQSGMLAELLKVHGGDSNHHSQKYGGHVTEMKVKGESSVRSYEYAHIYFV